MEISNFQYNPINFGYGMWETRDKKINMSNISLPVDPDLKPETEELYPDGEIKYQKYSDGREVGYFDNGIPAFRINQDGTREEYYPTGLLKYKENPDGEAVGYYPNGIVKAYKKFATGQIDYYKMPKNIAIQYYSPDPGNVITPKRPAKSSEFVIRYDNGNIKEQINSDGSSISYYENGNIQRKRNADFTQETYYENGNLKTLDTKEEHNTYYENGKPKEIFRRYNGSSFGEEYYPNGRMKRNRHISARIDYPSTKEYYPNGQTKYIEDAYGYYKTYDENGNVIPEKSKISSNYQPYIVDKKINGIGVFTVDGEPVNKLQWTKENGGN